MKIQKSLVVLALIVSLSASSPVFAEQTAGESHKARTWLAIGGFLGGLFAGGMMSYWCTAKTNHSAQTGIILGTAVAGGVGGYFLGRAIDKSQAAKRAQDAAIIKQAQAKAAEAVVNSYQGRFHTDEAIDGKVAPVNPFNKDRLDSDRGSVSVPENRNNSK